MGSWGTGIFENDCAQDAIIDLDKVKCIDLMKLRKVRNLLKYPESTFIVVEAQIDRFGKVTDKAYKKFLEAYEQEMDNLDDWKLPEKRKKSLEEFHERVSEKRMFDSKLDEFGFGEITTTSYLKKNQKVINIKTDVGLENLTYYLNFRLDITDNMNEVIKGFLNANTANEIMINGYEYSLNLTEDNDDFMFEYMDELMILFKDYAIYKVNEMRK